MQTWKCSDLHFLHVIFTKTNLSRSTLVPVGSLTSPLPHLPLSIVTGNHLPHLPGCQTKGQSEYWLGVEEGDEFNNLESSTFANKVASIFLKNKIENDPKPLVREQ